MVGKRILTIMAITSVIVQSVGVTAQAAGKGYKSNRLGGKNRIETSLKIASEFNNGKVDAVVVTTSVSFPDALTGSALAAKYKAPLLLVNSTANDSKDSLDFIKNHLAENGKVYILGGTGVISQDIENAIRGMGYSDIKRLGGKNRMETSRIINKEIGVTEGTPVFLVSAANFPDALSASSIAGIKGYPILLSNKDSLPEDTEQLLREIKPSKVYVVGGTGAVSDTILTKLRGMVGSATRICGDNRYNTSLAIAKYFGLNTTNAVLASGKNFPDALVGSAVAVKNNAPIILIDSNTAKQKEYFESTKIDNLIVLGGEGSIPTSILDSLSGITTNPGKPVETDAPEVKKDGKYTKIRFNATDEYGVAVQMSNEFVKNNSIVSDGSVDVTSGYRKTTEIDNCILIGNTDNAGSITSAPLSVYLNAPVLLTGKNELNAKTQTQLAKLKIKNVYIVGGTGEVSSDVETNLKSLGYNVIRYGGKDDIETNRIAMKAIPNELYGYEPKVVNADDFVQGASVALDTRCWYKNKDRQLINPIFLIPSYADSKEYLEDIADMLKPARERWEIEQPGWFGAWVDNNIRNNMLSSQFNEEGGMTEELLAEQNIKIDELYSPLNKCYNIISGYKQSNTFANISINGTFNRLAGPFVLKGALVCSVDNIKDNLAVPALSAKYAMRTVFGGKSIQEVTGVDTLESWQVNDLFTELYSSAETVYLVGDTDELPEGSEKILSAK